MISGCMFSVLALFASANAVTIDFLTREGDIEPFAAVAERYAPFAGAEIAWGQLSKLTWKMRVVAELRRLEMAILPGSGARARTGWTIS